MAYFHIFAVFFFLTIITVGYEVNVWLIGGSFAKDNDYFIDVFAVTTMFDLKKNTVFFVCKFYTL